MLLHLVLKPILGSSFSNKAIIKLSLAIPRIVEKLLILNKEVTIKSAITIAVKKPFKFVHVYIILIFHE